MCGYERRGYGSYETASALKPGQMRVAVPNVYDQFGRVGSIRKGDIIEIRGEVKLVTVGCEGVVTNPNHRQAIEFVPGMRKEVPVGTVIECDSPQGLFQVRQQPPTAAVQEISSELLPIGQLQVTLFESDPLQFLRAPAGVEPQDEADDADPDEDDEDETPDDPGAQDAPEVNAGIDRSYRSPERGSLDGYAVQRNSDGLIDRDAQLTYEWRSVRTLPSGQTTRPVIANPNALRTSFTTTGLQDGQYTFELTATNTDDMSDADTVTHRVGSAPSALVAPPTFTASRPTRSSIFLSWGRVPDVTGWQVREKPFTPFQPGDNVQWRDVPANARFYNFSRLAPNTAYYFQVRAVRDDTEGPVSEANSRTTARTATNPPVRGLSVSGISSTGAVVTWQAPLTGASFNNPSSYRWDL